MKGGNVLSKIYMEWNVAVKWIIFLYITIEAVRSKERFVFSEKVIFGQTYEWWNGGIYEELEKEYIIGHSGKSKFIGSDISKEQVQRFQVVTSHCSASLGFT